MAKKRFVKRAEKLGDRYNTEDWHITTISGLFYNIEENLGYLINCSEKETLSGRELLKVKECTEKIEKSVNEILVEPRLKKYAKKYKTFLGDVLKEKDSIYQEIKDKNFAGKSLEIGVAQKLIDEMKAFEPVIDNDYRFLKASINSGSLAAIQDIHFEGDAYGLLIHLRNVSNLHSDISSLTTEKQFEQELNDLKVDSTSVYNAISAMVVRDYDKLKTMDKKLQQERPEFKNYYPIIRNDINNELEKL